MGEPRGRSRYLRGSWSSVDCASQAAEGDAEQFAHDVARPQIVVGSARFAGGAQPNSRGSRRIDVQ